MKLLFISLVLLAISGCATTKDKLLDPGKESAQEQMSAHPSYQKLIQILKAREIQGVGLQYETEATLDLLYRVFSDTRTANRQVSIVYTGLSLSYDPRYRSLTIGGTNDANVIIAYIQKSIPAKSVAK